MLTEVTTNSGSLQQTVSLCTEMMSAYPQLRQQSLKNVEVHFNLRVFFVVVVVVLFGWEGNREELLGLGFLLFFLLFFVVFFIVVFCFLFLFFVVVCFDAGGLLFSGAGVALLTGFYQCMKTGQVCTEYRD